MSTRRFDFLIICIIMITKQGIEKVSGIYKIINKTNGRYYVGSSNNIHRRWLCHKQDLKRKTHRSRFLQRSWNKYGPEAFDFLILEKNIPEKNLLITEQKYLDISSNEKDKCYNSSFIAGKVEMNKATRKKISKSNMGKKMSEETKQKLREITLKQFENGMPEETKIKLRGRTPSNIDTTTHSFTNIITGEMFNGIRRDFYAKYNLSRRKVSCLINRKERSHKNWMLSERAGTRKNNYDKTIYSFRNINTEETFKGTRMDFYTKYNLTRSLIDCVIHKKRKSHKGWILI